jgi:hypothetical protein
MEHVDKLVALLPPQIKAMDPWLAVYVVVGYLIFCEWYKVLPFSYHIRVILTLIRCRLFGKPLETVDGVTRWRGRVCICEMDWNMHQNNSNYALEIDVQRYEWFIAFLRRNSSVYPSVKIANGGVNHFFLKEMRYGQKYEIRTYAVGCDRKWLYLRTDFVSPRGDKLFAVGISRIVFKELSGKTIAPVEILERLSFDLKKSPAFTVSNDEPGAESESLAGKYAQVLTAMVPESVAPTPKTPVSTSGGSGTPRPDDALAAASAAAEKGSTKRGWFGFGKHAKKSE